MNQSITDLENAFNKLTKAYEKREEHLKIIYEADALLLILQYFDMSGAKDFFNQERAELAGDIKIRIQVLKKINYHKLTNKQSETFHHEINSIMIDIRSFISMFKHHAGNQETIVSKN